VSGLREKGRRKGKEKDKRKIREREKEKLTDMYFDGNERAERFLCSSFFSQSLSPSSLLSLSLSLVISFCLSLSLSLFFLSLSFSQPGADDAYDSRFITKLTRNYRSHPALLHLPSSVFYDNELEVRRE
jgi:hypothetical protein